jgi:hypothetical protein
MVAGFSVFGCGTDTDFESLGPDTASGEHALYPDEPADPQPPMGECTPLMAGQHIEAGWVCVHVKPDVDTSRECGPGSSGVLVVEYHTMGGWELVEAHLAVGNHVEDIPNNNKGNPMVGHFDYHSGNITGMTEFEFYVPLCKLGMDGGSECKPTMAVIASHAVVQKKLDDGSYQTETGWGDGERFVPRGSWAEYWMVTLTCDKPPEEPAMCESAWARSKTWDHPFCDFDCLTNNRRWGFTNGPFGAGTHLMEVYAGGGGGNTCEPNAPSLTGWLSLHYDGETAMVTYSAAPGYEWTETHLYVGNAPLMGYPDACTVAPGQFAISSNEGGMELVHHLGGLTGEIYVAAHAEVCEK